MEMIRHRVLGTLVRDLDPLSKYLIKECDNGVLVHRHLLTLPARGTREGHAALTSINAFRRRSRDSDRFRVLMQGQVEPEDLLGIDSPDTPHTLHETLWVFYEAIGYDWRRRRFKG